MKPKVPHRLANPSAEGKTNVKYSPFINKYNIINIVHLEIPELIFNFKFLILTVYPVMADVFL